MGWNTQDGKYLFTLSGVQDEIICCAISPDSQSFLCGCRDGTITIWDREKCKIRWTKQVHRLDVNDCVFSLDGKYVISASSDRTVKILNSETGDEFTTMEGHTHSVKKLWND